MADITMCSGLECPLKGTCYRHTATANPYRQSYFMIEPLDENDECPEWVDNGIEPS